MLCSADRIVAPCSRGGWEVRAPDAPSGPSRRGRPPVLRAPTRAEALQWAWNITGGTGGRVVVRRSDGSSP